PRSTAHHHVPWPFERRAVQLQTNSHNRWHSATTIRSTRAIMQPTHDKEATMVSQPVISRDHEILGGTPVFAGTRVPVQTLLDYLEAGQSLQEFLDDFPTVQRTQAITVLEQLKHILLTQPVRTCSLTNACPHGGNTIFL